jgi:hypothetical protein
MLIEGMKNATNDNNTWQSLAAATARVISKLEEEKPEDRADHGAEHQKDEQAEKTRRDYLEYRMAQIAKFETRANGGRRRP